jgi:hypothetical protein
VGKVIGSRTWNACIDDHRDRVPSLPATVRDIDLAAMTEQTVAVYLLNAYRLRIEDERVIECTIRRGTLHSPLAFAPVDVLADLNAFLDLVERRPGLLLTWWVVSAARKRVIETGSKRPASWCNLESSVELGFVVRRHGDERTVGRLRRLVGRIYGGGIVDRREEVRAKAAAMFGGMAGYE